MYVGGFRPVLGPHSHTSNTNLNLEESAPDNRDGQSPKHPRRGPLIVWNTVLPLSSVLSELHRWILYRESHMFWTLPDDCGLLFFVVCGLFLSRTYFNLWSILMWQWLADYLLPCFHQAVQNSSEIWFRLFCCFFFMLMYLIESMWKITLFQQAVQYCSVGYVLLLFRSKSLKKQDDPFQTGAIFALLS